MICRNLIAISKVILRPRYRRLRLYSLPTGSTLTVATMRCFVDKLWKDDSGQDLIEYALLAALVATGSAILMPQQVHAGIIRIFSKVGSCLDRFGGVG